MENQNNPSIKSEFNIKESKINGSLIQSHKEPFSKNIMKNLKRILKYLLISVTLIIVLYFIIYYLRLNSLESLEKTKSWSYYIPYFKINLETSFRYSKIWDDDGEILYKINLEGDTAKFDFDNYDKNGSITINFLDNEGFKIDEYVLSIDNFLSIVPNGKRTGFIKRDNWSTTTEKYKSYKSIDVSWTIHMLKK